MPKTINDIAKLAQVSTATVSRVLNPKTVNCVKNETKKKILSVIKKHGYIPNRSAVNLAQNKAGIIGLAIPYFASHLNTNDYFSSMVSGVMDTISNQVDYELKLIIVPQGKMNSHQIQMLNSRRIDGLILSGWPTFTQINEIIASPIPKVIINDFDDQLDTHFIYADHFHGGYLAAKHFIDQNYKKIAITTPSPEWFPDMDQRFNGFKKAIKDAKLSLPNKWIIPCGVTEESAYKKIIKLIESKTLPEAMFFMNDITAIGALKALKEKNISCPDEIAIIGFDNIRLCNYISPSLSTIHQPVFEMAKEATKILVDLISKPEQNFIRKKIPVKLIIRDSC